MPMNFEMVNHLYRCSKEYSHGQIRDQGLSDTEYIICTYVYSHDLCSQDDVAKAKKIDKTTVGKAIQTLEDKKCIERKADENDKRRKLLHLTKTGCDKVQGIVNIHDEWFEKIIQCLSQEEQARFEEYCQKIIAYAKEFDFDK